MADFAQLSLAACQLILILFAYVTLRNDRKRSVTAQKEATFASEQTRKNQEIEIYQRLEIESTSVFKFESQYNVVLPYFKSNLAHSKIFKEEFLLEGSDSPTPVYERQLIARKYYEQTLNLFEIATRLRKAGIIHPEVFGSWVAWFFDALTEWGLRGVWADLRDNYTVELRDMLDTHINRLIREWDRPHHDRTFTAYAEADELSNFRICEHEHPLYVQPEILEQLRREYYKFVGDLLDCNIIRNWLENCEKTKMEDSPYAYK